MIDTRAHHSERGAALVLVLVILLTLTVLGVGVIISTTTNFALSRNYEVATQAQNMADTAARIAYREFITAGFLQTTHTEDMAAQQSGGDLLLTELENCTIDADGNYLWEWDTSSAYDPLWDTDKPHGFTFRVYYTTPNAFVIETDGWYDKVHRRTRAKGEVETMFQFSYFASRDLGEFTRGAAQEIRGKVHANGNMYVRPSGSTLKVNTNSFTATGFIIRTRDAWGRPDDSGQCLITKTAEDGTFIEMEPDIDGPRGTDGAAFDSFNADWDDKTQGARKKWGGVVRDKVPYKSPPPVQNLEPGEYYNELATSGGLVIDASSHSQSWCSKITNCWNYNEQRTEVMWEIDMGQLVTSGQWPGNNLIYAEVPIRIANADSIGKKVMISSCRNVYTKGDFNTSDKQGSCIMTTMRIYHLSAIFSDAQSTNSKNRAAVTTRINAALVDGAPTVDEYNWCDRDGDHRYDYNNGLIYDNWDSKTAAGFNNPANSGDPWANCDDLVENWGGCTLTKFGSVVHMGESYEKMTPNLDNSGIQSDEIGWVRKTGYNPPTRNYMYDPDLATPSGQPPFTPLIGHITSWEPY